MPESISRNCWTRVTPRWKFQTPEANGDIVSLDDARKALELSGHDNVLFRRNSVTGAVEAVPWKGTGIALNEALHAN